MADIQTDKMYRRIRDRFGGSRAQANGYRFNFFFKSEQNSVLSAINTIAGPLLDVACGSGLMILPLLNSGTQIYGVDFNQQACEDAHANKIPIVRGDAFGLPLADASVAKVVNCQFLNQQNQQQTEILIREMARVLKPGGRLVLTWRHANSKLHRLAAKLFNWKDGLESGQQFPQYAHPFQELQQLCANTGLVVKKQAVTLPLGFLPNLKPTNPLSNLFGASQFLVADKN